MPVRQRDHLGGGGEERLAGPRKEYRLGDHDPSHRLVLTQILQGPGGERPWQQGLVQNPGARATRELAVGQQPLHRSVGVIGELGEHDPALAVDAELPLVQAHELHEAAADRSSPQHESTAVLELHGHTHRVGMVGALERDDLEAKIRSRFADGLERTLIALIGHRPTKKAGGKARSTPSGP